MDVQAEGPAAEICFQPEVLCFQPRRQRIMPPQLFKEIQQAQVEVDGAPFGQRQGQIADPVELVLFVLGIAARQDEGESGAPACSCR